MLIGTLCVFVIILLLTPNVDARNNNCQKVAGITESGPREYKEPAVSATEDLLAIAYTYKPYSEQGGSTKYEIRVAISFDGGFSFNTLHVKVNEKDNNCRFPDVLVTKMYSEGNEEEIDVIFVVWQELTGYYWQINSKSFYIDSENDLQILDGEKYLSKIENGFLTAKYPRIEGGYLPYQSGDTYTYDSATINMVVWQQEYHTQGNYRIRCSYYDYQTHFSSYRLSHSNTLWTNAFDWLEQPIVESDSIEHPSVDMYVKRNICSCYSIPEASFSVSYEQKIITGGATSYNGCVNPASRSMHYSVNQNNPAEGFLSIDSVRKYNLNSNGWCYPDVAYYEESSNYFQTVAFQDPDDGCAKVDATGYAFSDPEMSIGICKSSTLRGISLDHIDPEYIFPASAEDRSGWSNPGGITVIWRSDVTIPNTQDKYGIDSINLEYKNNHLRLSHNYSDGSDDENTGTDYNPVPVYHETSNSVDEYIDIKSVEDEKSHVSFKRNNQIWYFSLINYV